MDKHKEVVYKSALLHDIGKFWQRTYNADTLKEFGPGMEKHPVLSKKFAEEWLGDDDIAYIVANHHEGDLKKSSGTSLQKALAALVCEGDNLASSEREDDDLPYRRFFQAILSKVMLKDRDEQPWKQALGRLTADGFEFPFENKNTGDSMTQQYRKQWDDLYEEAGRIKDIHPDSLLYLCKKYLWCIPAAFYKNVPDISLYEHSRLTAALALCLHDFIAEKNNGVYLETLDIDQIKKMRDEPAYLMVCGDITGIQKFIYNIAHAGAMKALKGRSFWLQQVVDSIAYTILERCNLYHANILFSTGGKFCLLLPNTKKVEIELGDLQPEMEKKLLAEYDGNLSLVIGKLAVSGEEILKVINERWAELFRITDEAKTKKYKDILTDPTFFGPGALHGELALCQATKRELTIKTNLPVSKPVRMDQFKPFHFKHEVNGELEVFEELDDDGNILNPNNRQYISSEQYRSRWVGSDLRKETKAIFTSDYSDFSIMGLEYIDFVNDRKNTNPAIKNRILYLNNDNHLHVSRGKEIIQGWRFYGGDWRFDGTFEELIKQAYNYPRLGVLRMDVDNLGHVFHKGLKKPAFSRIVQLSTMMDFFFSCYLNKLKSCWWCVNKGVVETEEETKNEKDVVCLEDALNIVYAGGDDLFIVGVWNVLPDVARWIHTKFTAFSCNNPDLTLSAGIALFENKFPLYKVAKYAQDALDQAKSWKTPGESKSYKNSICFLGVPMRWEDFEFVQAWARQWANWVDGKKVSKGFINVLNAMGADYDDHVQLVKRLQKEDGPNWYKKHIHIPADPLWGRWRWRGCYYLNRFADRIRNDKELEKEIREFSTNLFINKFERSHNDETIKIERNCIEILPVAVRWADYLTRTKSEE
ncbi:MAG: type III-A CRISPR-associated protein Cas10/Csm1 [Saprospiraceae bacterium]|nr:type III-A CRISPR-associated protein Cas10/Csm1 [Saprospiraceae bacterium]